MVVVEIVDEIPKDVLIRLSHFFKVNFHLFIFQEHNFNPFVQLFSTDEDRVFLVVTIFVIFKFLPDHDLQFWGGNWFSTICAQCLDIFKYNTVLTFINRPLRLCLEVFNSFSELWTQKLTFTVSTFFLKLQPDFIKKYRWSISSAESSFPKPSFVLDLTVQSAVRIKILSISIIHLCIAIIND
jgi:hypothetical protein